MRVSHPRLRARRLLLRRRFFFWRWLSGNCCLVINSVVYQMPQGIVDTYPTLTISLHRSKNKPWLSCPNISAIRPQAVVVAREHRLLCTTQTKRNRKAEPWKVDVKREDKVRVKSNLCDAKSYVWTTSTARLTRRFPSSTSTFQHDDAPRHLLPLPQIPPPTPSPIGRRIHSGSAVWRACEGRRRRE